VVSWNGKIYLKECLDAILAQLGLDDEIIVVDNASTDGSASLVRSGYPQVRLIENEHNLGFAGGVNRGLEVARGNILVLINQDVVLRKGCLEALYHRLSKSGPGIVGCKLLYPDGRTIQHAGGIIRLPRGESDHRGYRQIDDGRWDSVEQVDYVTGAVFAFDRTVLNKVGQFDEGFYPGYYEEGDYCFRARAAGFPVIYEPNAVALHHETRSYDTRSVAYHRAMQRGRLRFVLKNFDRQQLTDFFPAEQEFVRNLPSAFARQVMASAYLYTLLNMPDAIPAVDASHIPGTKQPGYNGSVRELLDELSELHLQALQCSTARKAAMNSYHQPLELPKIREHDFQSHVPVFGPIIQFIRRALYQLTAKWGIVVVIDQQNRINQMLTQYLRELDDRLRELDDRLIDQDRDLAYVSRAIAELEIQQRHLLRLIQARSDATDQNALGK